MHVEVRQAIDPQAAAGYGTDRLRAEFLIQSLFVPGEIRLTYSQYDRMVVGGATPAGAALKLEPVKQAGTPSFLDRRELVAVNIGGKGTISAGNDSFTLDHRDMLYLGMGAGEVFFASADAANPAKFYLLSAPAHHSYPSRLVRIGEANRLDLGAQATSNERSIYQFIHPDVLQTCQLVVGMTVLAPGSVWNTMPCHVHDRRSEAYLYFALGEDARVVHLMGEPNETRHLIVKNEEAILSPGWSIHSGAGTSNYTFIWAMAGDNVDYKDVDMVAMGDLR
ncbi:5-dehydro-4-deoxy-D-glucuronate isomerase [Mesorhizobium sp. J428]|uniref:5-dehydro-4-deoxy-D-glucuronate isomerase n=1 Tax=Mesorhizobium sp. J428 TaxID=2898440 RepID=UPI0021519F04|nr:5-dehydro-4-deoxy-D-glucuronate isomerase [Mesorhizobium sp. J428]MCR5857663.1 5-dehydro-4-deoxy-D-glucuronate isomerase [Mesorhizobium sp. J428]